MKHAKRVANNDSLDPLGRTITVDHPHVCKEHPHPLIRHAPRLTAGSFGPVHRRVRSGRLLVAALLLGLGGPAAGQVAGSGAGSNAGSGAGSNAGNGAGPNTGSGAGSNIGSGAEQHADPGARPGAKVPTRHIAVGQHVEPVMQAMLAIAEPAAAGAIRLDVETVPETGVWLRSLCKPPTAAAPRIVLTTRAMPPGLAKNCETLIQGKLAAVELGRDAIVLAVRAGGPAATVATHHVYHALARDTAAGDEFRRNVAIRWSDVDPALPPLDIRFQLPPRTDHRRHIFDMLVMEGGCRGEGLIKGIFEASQRTARCTTIRIDRVREVAREHAVRALLEAPPGTVGVLSYRDVAESDGKLVAVALNGVIPTPLTIQEGTYPFASSHWLYARRDVDPTDPDGAVAREVGRIVTLAQSDPMIGPDGLLAEGGIIPLPADERAAQRARLAAQDEPLSLTWVASWALGAVSGTWNFVSAAYNDIRAPDEPDPVDLPKLMDTAGYKLAAFESTVGLIPGASMIFKITREMSDSDRDFLERELNKDARARPGFRSALQRRLIQAIIDISESDGFQVSKVDVTLLPLPKVDLTISPKGSDSGSDSMAVLRAIERLQERMPEAWR